MVPSATASRARIHANRGGFLHADHVAFGQVERLEKRGNFTAKSAAATNPQERSKGIVDAAGGTRVRHVPLLRRTKDESL